jgi:CDP-glucose 4,6-dehydratase
MPRASGHPVAVSTARGGNVIGGGDWSPHRIVPDVVRALRDRAPLRLRRPEATRPWQHVLDLSYAYLLLGYRLITETAPADAESGPGQAWNFGPAQGEEMTVAALAAAFLARWGEPEYPVESIAPPHHETTILRLDSSRANQDLGWQLRLNGAATIDWTADWYHRYLQGPTAAGALITEQLDRFEHMLARHPSAPVSAARAAGSRGA